MFHLKNGILEEFSHPQHRRAPHQHDATPVSPDPTMCGSILEVTVQSSDFLAILSLEKNGYDSLFVS
jgi:hypothetical protein